MRSRPFVLVALAAGLVSAACGSGSGSSGTTNRPYDPAPLPATTEAAVPFAVPKVVLKTAREFVRAAVLREDLARAWDLSAPSLREGLGRDRWLSGTIPVVPYPRHDFGRAQYTVVEANPTDVMLDVLIAPRPGSSLSSVRFYMHLVPASSERWLVSYWAPQGGGGGIPLGP
jgi:hypothetical protein